MKKLLLLVPLLSIIGMSIDAQVTEVKPKLDESKIVGTASKSQILTAEFMGEVNTPSADLKWRPTLTHKCVGFEPETPNEELIKKIKSEKEVLKLASMANKNSGSEPITQSVTPVVGTNYLGNLNNGSSPLDNSMAISNGGWIVSVANTTIEYDDINGNTQYYNDIVTFINDVNITGVCDPVVIYDASMDRFIFFCQTCPLASGSKILIFFSKTNNPQNGWWYYKLTGDPLSNNDAFDYPKLAVSTNELYVAGNLFTPPYSNCSCFDQAVLYQIPKAPGYSGGSLNWQYWYNISGSPFTLLPVSYGQQGSYGPGCYCVATDNAGSSTIKLYDLTDDMSGNPSLNLYNVSTPSYSPASDANQLGTSCKLSNGDCRALSGFYLNGTIHFVFHSDIGSGWNGINYNRLDPIGQTNQSSTFGLSGSYDYSYPTVVSYATTTTDKSVMIGFGRSSSAIYPEERVVNCDNSMTWSGSTLVKSSLGYVSYTSSTVERWGDYTGSSRKHNSSYPSIWMTGSYGTSSNEWNAWNAEIHDASVGGVNENSTATDVKIFPNPIIETFAIEFTLENSEQIEIGIIDVGGKVVKQLYKGNAHSGTNIFSFNKANLSAGEYFLTIKTNSKIIKNEKIIIAK